MENIILKQNTGKE